MCLCTRPHAYVHCLHTFCAIPHCTCHTPMPLLTLQLTSHTSALLPRCNMPATHYHWPTMYHYLPYNTTCLPHTPATSLIPSSPSTHQHTPLYVPRTLHAFMFCNIMVLSCCYRLGHAPYVGNAFCIHTQPMKVISCKRSISGKPNHLGSTNHTHPHTHTPPVFLHTF